jgi:hypothetical protein
MRTAPADHSLFQHRAASSSAAYRAVSRRREIGTCPSWSTVLAHGYWFPAPAGAGLFHDRQAHFRYSLGPMLSGRRDDPRPFFRERDASGISEVTQASAAEMCSAIQSSAPSALSSTRTMLTFEIPGGRIGREPSETTKTLSRRRVATR